MLSNCLVYKVNHIKTIPTPMEMLSSEGNLAMNLLPAFSSEEFKGLTRQMTLMLHSSDSVGSPIFAQFLMVFSPQGSKIVTVRQTTVKILPSSLQIQRQGNCRSMGYYSIHTAFDQKPIPTNTQHYNREGFTKISSLYESQSTIIPSEATGFICCSPFWGWLFRGYQHGWRRPIRGMGRQTPCMVQPAATWKLKGSHARSVEGKSSAHKKWLHSRRLMWESYDYNTVHTAATNSLCCNS